MGMASIETSFMSRTPSPCAISYVRGLMEGAKRQLYRARILRDRGPSAHATRGMHLASHLW
jgi:hypothetical protein